MKKGRRLLAILMAICLVCAYMPVSAFADGEITMSFPDTYCTVNGNIATYSVDGTAVTLEVQGVNVADNSFKANRDDPAGVTFKLGNAFNPDTMVVAAYASDGFKITLGVNEDNTTSLANKSTEGVLPDSLTLKVEKKQDEQNGGGEQGPPSPPAINTGDVLFLIGSPKGGSVSYSFDGTNWVNAPNNSVISNDNIGSNKKIFVKYELNEGYKLDDYIENDISVNYIKTDDKKESLSFDSSNTASFTYDLNKKYEIQIRFMQDGGNQPPEQGNLPTTVNVTFWEYESDSDQYVKLTDRQELPLEGIRINGFEGVMGESGSMVFNNAGYALDDKNNTNAFTMQASFGTKIDKLYLIDSDKNKISGSDFIAGQEDTFSYSAAPAETYNIAFEQGVSDDLTIIWTTNYNTADLWTDSAVGGEFAYDMYVEHGNVRVKKIMRGENTIYDVNKDGTGKFRFEGAGVDISDDFGYINLKRGDSIELQLIPDYGYQLATVGGQDVSSQAVAGLNLSAGESVSTFTISSIQNNIHFSSIFVPAENKVNTTESSVKSVSVVNGENAASNGGILGITVKDEETTADISGTAEGEAVATVDIGIDNLESKGTATEGDVDYWSNAVTEFTNPITINLGMDNLDSAYNYSVVREHDGNLTELPATVSNGQISFESNQFSKYTIVKKAKNESGSITPSTPAPSVPSDNDITNSGSGADASTSVDVSDKTTVTDSKAETKVDADLGNKIVENALKNNSTDVVINAGTSAGDSAGSTVTLPESTVKALAKDTEASVTIKTDSAEVSLDKDEVAAVAAQAGSEGEVKLVVETKEQNKNKVEIELTLVTSNGTVSSFNGGTVTVTVPVSQELADKKVVCVYIDENGKYHKVDGAINEAGTHYTFTTGHFSTYAVMSEEDAEAVIKQQTADEQKAKIKKVKATVTLSTKDLKKGIRVTVKVPENQKADKTGIIIYRSTKKDAKTYAVYKKVATKGSTYIIRNTKNVKEQKLTSGKKYYYKVRAYKVIDGKTYYGPMSSVKSIKAK